MPNPNKLKKLILKEVSVVDRGANPHAHIALFKRDEGAGNPAGDHVQQKELKMQDDAKKVADLESSVADLTKKLETATAGIEKANAEKSAAEAIAKLNGDEKAHYDKFGKAEDKKRFLEMKDEDRKKEVKKAAESDEVLKVEGTEIRKSAVGEAAFAVMKSQQAAIQKQADDLKKAEEAREMADLRKRADDDYKHVVGTSDEKAAVLKAIKGMDEPVRKSAETILAACEKMTASGFAKIGHGNGRVAEGSADSELDKKAKEYAKANSVPFAKAYDEVLNSDEGKELYKRSLAESQPRAS